MPTSNERKMLSSNEALKELNNAVIFFMLFIDLCDNVHTNLKVYFVYKLYMSKSDVYYIYHK